MYTIRSRRRKVVIAVISCAAVVLFAEMLYSVGVCVRIRNHSAITLQDAYGLMIGTTLCAVMILVALVMMACLVRRDSQDVSQKDSEIQYREMLFSLLTQYTDYIFILFSPETFAAEYISPNLERVIGIEPDQIRGDVRKIGRVVINDVSALSEEILSGIPQGGTWKKERELLHLQTGEHRWYKEILCRVKVEENEKCIMILSDCMEEHQMKETLENALSAAEAANKAKSNFLSNMSHDIRTPMNAIVGFTMLLSEDADQPDKVREYTRKITTSSRHLLSLINDVLDMSKIESGRTALNISEFSMPSLLESINAIILPQVKAKGQTYKMRLLDAIPEILLGDELRVNQILINLLSNAVKYTPEGGSISFEIRSLSRLAANSVRLQFKVQDNGYGMSQDFLGEIFDPFSREEVNPAVSKVQGTGLGMPITKSIVELMGGIIEVKSRQGEGSTFTVEMEFAVMQKDRDKEFWAHHAISRMLVVDDEEYIGLRVRRIMADTGVAVDYTTTGKAAVEMVRDARDRQEDYHVILLDWKMPDMGGVETARLIRECVGREVPIILFTSYGWAGDEEEAKAAGIDAFMTKPFFLSMFQDAIRNIMELDEKDKLETEEYKDTLEGALFLVAEDNGLNAEILSKMLEMVGAGCELAVNGQEAFDMFRQSRPGHYDMILMDIQMPVMNGYDATRMIRCCGHPQAYSIPIVAMTANAFAEDVKNALDAGMNDHVAKPVDMGMLRNTLRKYLNK